MNSVALLGFFHIASEGSITAAATRMGVAKSTLSSQLTLLEKETEVRLFHRNTRKMTLTDAGQQLFFHAKKVKKALRDAKLSIEGHSEEITGKVTVAGAVDSGSNLLPPLIGSFYSKHPRVTVELRTSNTLIDLVAEGVDIAFRTGVQVDSSLIAMEVSSFKPVLVVSPSFIDRQGEPNHPKEIDQYFCLVHQSATTWHLSHSSSGQTETAHPTARFVSDSLATINDLAINGLGVAALPDYRVRENLSSGKLVQILTDWHFAKIPYFMVYPNRMAASRAARALIEHSREYFKENHRKDDPDL
jgi:DNA-binding transcriptional LysR family regulator